MPPVPRFCAQCGASLVESLVDDHPRDVCPACGTIAYRNPLPVASALVLNDRREVLLVRRRLDPQAGAWCLPIGFAEVGETILQATLRELREETGIEGRILRLLDVDSHVSHFYGDLLIVTYEVERVGGVETAGTDAEATACFPIDSLPPLAFGANDRAVRACRELHREEWAMRDSFDRLQSGQASEMLSDALVALIHADAQEVGRRWLAEVRENPTTPSYQRAVSQPLLNDASTALSQFGRWLQGDQAENEIRAFYHELGERRRAAGFGLHEVLSSLMLLRKHIYAYARSHGVWERPLEAYRVLELDRRLVLFFDRAMYHVARGYAAPIAPPPASG